MLFGFIGRISSANQLKENLDLSTQRTRGIAQRVAGATLQNQAGFAMPNGEVVSQPEAVNLEAEMTSLAGVMALSTYLPLRDSLAAEASPANREVPILMCHGQRDQMLPMTLGSASRDFLQSLGYQVEWKASPMEHSV